MRFWLFRLAHNCSVDLPRKRKPEVGMNVEYHFRNGDRAGEDALERAKQKQSARAAISSFMQLQPAKRSTVILKDVTPAFRLIE